MLLTRIITAVVLLLVLLFVLVWGGQLGWNAFVCVVLLATFWEWGRLGKLQNSTSLYYALACSTVFGLMLWYAEPENITFPLMALSGLFWIILAPLSLRKVSIGTLENPALFLPLGLVLGCAAGLALELAFRHGIVFLLSVVAICWAADIFAYVFGKLFGKHKLAPKVSPGKSWEGAIGGTFTVVLLSWAVVWLGNHYAFFQETWQYKAHLKFPPVLFTFWLVVLSAFSIVGDLFESLLKRRVDMKDSSNLLPGHGGVLDRIDAQLPVLPLAILLLGSAGI